MKKIVLAVAVLSLCASVPVFADEMQTEEMRGMSMGMPGMGSMMGKTQMVATGDGGVIVLAGNKLMKYDAGLNFVKEAEVKVSTGPMGGKQCPMMGNAAASGADAKGKTA